MFRLSGHRPLKRLKPGGGSRVERPHRASYLSPQIPVVVERTQSVNCNSTVRWRFTSCTLRTTL